ncbi:MAG: DUF3611 family protein [Cyanobacteria bacterium J06638_22]
MSSQLDSYAVPPAVRRVANSFRRVGQISFWSQVVLGVVSTMVLLFTSLFLNNRSTVTTNLPNVPNVSTATQNNPGTGFGLFLTGAGLVILYASIYWAYSYIRLSKQLQKYDSGRRPKRTDVFGKLRMGLMISMAGMMFTILGGFAVVGTLVGKSFQVSAVSVFGGLPDQVIKGSDIFAVQGVFLVLLAHFIAIASSLWLLRAMSRQ